MIQVPPKFGFHTGPGGNPTGIGDYMRALDAAGIPMVIKSVDHYGPVFEAQEIMKKSGVPHVLVFRLSNNHNTGQQFDTPNYNAVAEKAAEDHWKMTKAALPPEFDKQRVWLEGVNEVDRNLADWLGWFAVRIANLAHADGYKVSLFGWAGGEPEPTSWETPGMLAYLRLCAERPAQAAVSIHEYSFITSDIFHQFPFKVGRFQYLFAVCDKHGIERPTTHITEWGWTLDDVPGPEQALNDMEFVGLLYAPYPNIQGAAIWYLGDKFGEIANKAQKLIKPVTDWMLKERFDVTLNPPITTLPAIDGWQQFPDNPPDPPGGDMCNPRVPYAREYLVVPQDATLARYLEVAQQAFAGRKTLAFSYDDAGHAPNVSSNTAVLYDIPSAKHQEFIDWYATHYPNTQVVFAGSPPPPPVAQIALVYRPCQTSSIPQAFGVNPANYIPLGLPAHEGLDYAVVSGGAFYAAAAGTVVHASDRKWSSNEASNYGWHVVIDHGAFCTVYAHAKPGLPVSVGQQVPAGHIVGYSGNTGNSKGYHLHFGICDKTGTIDPANGYPTWTHGRPVDPWPFVQGKPAPATTTPSDNYTGPAVTTFISGVDQPASDWYWSAGKAVYEVSKLAPKFHAGGTNHIWWDTFKNPAFNLVRVLLAPDFKGNAQAIFNETTANVQQFYARGARDFEMLNEPNIEGMGVRWSNGREFGTVFRELCKIYKSAYPEMRIWFPGMSPGFGAQHVFIADAAAVGAFDYVYGICEHVYSGIVDNATAASDQMVAEVKDFRKQWAMVRPLAITEFSVNRPASGAYKADTYKKFYAALANISGIQAAYSFTATWHPSADGNKEGWLENGIHNHF